MRDISGFNSGDLVPAKNRKEMKGVVDHTNRMIVRRNKLKKNPIACLRGLSVWTVQVGISP